MAGKELSTSSDNSWIGKVRVTLTSPRKKPIKNRKRCYSTNCARSKHCEYQRSGDSYNGNDNVERTETICEDVGEEAAREGSGGEDCELYTV